MNKLILKSILLLLLIVPCNSAWCQEIVLVSCPSSDGIETCPAEIHIINVATGKLIEHYIINKNGTPDSVALLPDSGLLLLWSLTQNGATEQTVLDIFNPGTPKSYILASQHILPGYAFDLAKGDFLTALFNGKVDETGTGYSLFNKDGLPAEIKIIPWLNVYLAGESFVSSNRNGLRIFVSSDDKDISHGVGPQYIKQPISLDPPQEFWDGVSKGVYKNNGIAVLNNNPSYLGLAALHEKQDFVDYFIWNKKKNKWKQFLVPGSMSSFRLLGEWIIVEVVEQNEHAGATKKVLFRKWEDASWAHLLLDRGDEIVAVTATDDVLFCTKSSLYSIPITRDGNPRLKPHQIITGLELSRVHWALWRIK